MAAMKVALVGIGKIARDQHVPALAASGDWELAATVSRSGTVEDIGMRSTRIRAEDGSLITVTNSELADRVIRNVSRRVARPQPPAGRSDTVT